MPYLKGEGKTALAIFVDGLDVKFVHIALRGKQFHLEDFKTVNLIKKLEERQAVSEAGMGLEGVDLLEASANAPIIQEGVAEETDEEPVVADLDLAFAGRRPAPAVNYSPITRRTNTNFPTRSPSRAFITRRLRIPLA